MPAPSSDNKPEVYILAKKMVLDCYELTHELSPEEKTNLGKYIRTAALTVFLDTAQGILLKKKKKRKKYLDAVINALVVIDAALEVLEEMGMVKEEQTLSIKTVSSRLYRLIKKARKKV